MIGFSLAHTFGVVLFLFPLVQSVWLAVAIGFLLTWKIKRRSVGRTTWIIFTAAALSLAALFTPQDILNRIFVAKLASSPRAADFLVHAAATGQLGVVKALLNRGQPVDAFSRGGSTALVISARTGEIETVSYLLSHGAQINLTDLYGDSPLHAAVERHHQDVAQLLTAKGARDIQGDKAQRERASQEIVHRDIEEMNHHSN